MRHHKRTRSFNRSADGRRALVRALCVSLVRDGRIVTTEAKAKELRPAVEKLVTASRKATVASRRAVASKVGAVAAAKLASEIAPRYAERQGGYTRITKLPRRQGDAAAMAQIEFV